MIESIKKEIANLQLLPDRERVAAVNQIMDALKAIHPLGEPVTFVKWVPAEMIVANDYNPNHVAPPEMQLLYVSIKEDGFTQPIVTYWDESRQNYIVVDGFHRNRIGRERADIKRRVKGLLPIVTIDKEIGERIASTIRHNRARGKHAVASMATIVSLLIAEGWSDSKVAKHLGMDADEVLRLKQAAGLPELFKNSDFSRAWE